jgi:hypothetical protein
MKLNKEPVAILAAVLALDGLLVAIGVLSPELGGAIGAALSAIGGLFVRGAVTANVNVAKQVTQQSQELVAAAAVETAARLDAVTTGPPGEVTAASKPVVAGVVAELLKRPKVEATSLVDSVLGPRRPRTP